MMQLQANGTHKNQMSQAEGRFFKTLFFFHLSFFPSLSLEEIMVVMETRALSNTELKTFITAHAQAMFFLLILVKQFSHF